MLAVYARRPRTWRPEEIDALQALAANTSAALANAELYSRVSLEKERSVAILANIADGIVAVDRDGKVVLWNAAAEEITGVPQQEAGGHTIFEVLQRQLEHIRKKLDRKTHQTETGDRSEMPTVVDQRAQAHTRRGVGLHAGATALDRAGVRGR